MAVEINLATSAIGRICYQHKYHGASRSIGIRPTGSRNRLDRVDLGSVSSCILLISLLFGISKLCTPHLTTTMSSHFQHIAELLPRQAKLFSNLTQATATVANGPVYTSLNSYSCCKVALRTAHQAFMMGILKTMFPTSLSFQGWTSFTHHQPPTLTTY